jgi:hypothetical protein
MYQKCGALNFTRQKLDIKGQTGPDTVIPGNFNTPL